MTFILPKKTRILWQLRIAVAIIFVFIIIFITAPLNLWVLLLVSLIGVVGVFVVLFYIPAFIKNYKLFIDAECVYINKGVFIKSLTVLPCVRLVIVKNLTTPIMSLLKLRIILLKVAKGWIFIPELDGKAAKQLLCLVRGENIWV